MGVLPKTSSQDGGRWTAVVHAPHLAYRPCVYRCLQARGGQATQTILHPIPGPDRELHCHGCSSKVLDSCIPLYLLSSTEVWPGLPRIWSSQVLHILARNLIATWVICGFWDWFLYFSPIQKKLHKYKMNPIYPSLGQIKHDALVTTSASCAAAGIEIILCYLWATGKLTLTTTLSDAPYLNLCMALLLTHYRIPPFHLIHRAMHPWKTTSFPDIGKFLYRQVHSLHHKSYNPTAFSGTNMHPVESTLYYSAALIPVAFGLHPVHALGVIVDCAMGAWLGHDGFQWPGSGDYFHMLNHKHFDCNYGAMHVPLDYLFGTYAGSKEEVSNIWKGKAAGEEANDTPVHEASNKAGKVE